MQRNRHFYSNQEHHTRKTASNQDLEELRKSVINLSNTPLTNPQITLPGKGLSFSPTPPYLNNITLCEEIIHFNRNLRLKYHFRDVPPPDTLPEKPLQPSTWTPPKGANQTLDQICDTLENIYPSTPPQVSP